MTEFGIKHSFSAINNYEDFALNVPISNYSDYASYISLITKGYRNILVNEPILKLVPSSGSSSPSKYIPYTKSLKHEFQEGLAPWIVNLFCKRKKLLPGKSYWSITPSIAPKNTTDSRIPIGFDEDSSYFGIFAKMFIRHLLIVPEEINQIEDIEASRYITLLFLLKEKNLRFISIWNPTFLSLLLEPIDKWVWRLISDIEKGTITAPIDIECSLKERLIEKNRKNPKRANELIKIFQQRKDKDSSTIYEKIWPYLSLISCWADGASNGYICEIKKYFPNVEVQPKGLLATEGCISFPLVNERGSILAARSHFFEFIEIGNEHNIKLAHQLKEKWLYSVVITTSGGLYRYRLGDIIKVIGFKNGYPLIYFVGKEDKVSDLFGEKINEYHVQSLLQDVFNRHSVSPAFFMLAPEVCPDNEKHCYTLFFEGDNISSDNLKKIELEVEHALCKNYNYSYCRKLGQLSRSKLFLIASGGWETYIRAHNSLNQKISVTKPPVLSPRIGWSKEFIGSFLS